MLIHLECWPCPEITFYWRKRRRRRRGQRRKLYFGNKEQKEGFQKMTQQFLPWVHILGYFPSSKKSFWKSNRLWKKRNTVAYVPWVTCFPAPTQTTNLLCLANPTNILRPCLLTWHVPFKDSFLSCICISPGEPCAESTQSALRRTSLYSEKEEGLWLTRKILLSKLKSSFLFIWAAGRGGHSGPRGSSKCLATPLFRC